MNALTPCLRGLAAVAALGVALTGIANPLTDEQSAEHESVSSALPFETVELERAFWICDYIATTEGVLAAPIALCATVTHELEQIKFGGDYDRMLAWWRENKPTEFAKLDRIRDDLAERDVSRSTT
jgi:hypothetical protein